MPQSESLKIGDRVIVKLDNGYRDTGIIVRRFKNGRYGIREDRKGAYHIRYADDVSKST